MTNISQACQEIAAWITQKKKTYVCVAPASTIVDCQSNKEYRDIVNHADMVTPDGMPLVWLGRAAGHRTIDRTYGPDLMRAFCDLSQQKGYKHFLYGGTSESLKQFEEKLISLYPKLNIVGSYAPPFRPAHSVEEDEIIHQINSSGADVIWIGLGSPKQDYWMVDHRKRIHVPVMVAVGAAFDFIAGVKKQAPVWIQRSGFEWLFRLCSEPKRLWKRYLFGNAKFIFYIIKYLISGRKQNG